MSRAGSFGVAANACGWLAVACAFSACVDDAVTLPDDWNTLHHRQITVDIFTRMPGAAGLARPLQGIDGAPLARHPELPDLTLTYWDRPGGSDDPDGVHVDIVRIGPETCELTLDGIYQGGEPQPESFDFAELERHAASVEGIRGEGLLLALDFSTAADGCGDADAFATALAEPATWAEAAASTVRHLNGDTLWNPGAHAYPIVGVQLFHMPDDEADEASAFALFAAAARRIDVVAPTVAIVSPELTLTATSFASGALVRFINAVVTEAVPLDVLSLRVTGDPATVATLVTALADHLEAVGLDSELAITTLLPAPLDLPFAADSKLGRAHLGASEMATRIRLQDSPVRWLFSGQGPWSVASSYQPSATATLGDSDLISTPYFDRAGVATAAFVMRAPMRQIEGEQRVLATTDAGDGLAVMATLDDGHVSILIAHPAAETGVGSITYTLTIPSFALPTFPSADYRIAEIDQSNQGIASFFYADLGTLDTDPTTGDIRLVRTLPVPGIHFIEIDQPLP